MSCCSPDRSEYEHEYEHEYEQEPGQEAPQRPLQATNRPESQSGRRRDPHRVEIEGGTFAMGTSGDVAYPEDGETLVHEVTVGPFQIDAHAVSNARFAEFIDATGYVTDGERFDWSFVFGGLLPDDFEETRGVSNAPWWRQVFGANWRKPEGPHSTIDDRADHPVIQVSHSDALAFCEWDGSRLPTEAEWEYAARGGLAGATFPWGDEREPNGRHRMNVWQGDFPAINNMADGFNGTAPVDTYEPNGFGLYNMCGNVWEWCADWYAADYYQHSPAENPKGPATGEQRIMRGGSYLCHESYCHRYRVGARSSSGPDSSAGNLGFRTVAGL